MILRHTFLLLLLFSSLIKTNAQCAISNVVVTVLACDDNDNFSASVNFDFDNVGENGFTVTGNGLNHGTFAYADLPVVLTQLPGNCITEWEFNVADVDDTTCNSSYNLGTICCSEECSVEIVNLVIGECNDPELSYGITFNLETTGTLGLGFDVFANGDNIGFYEYNQLPLTIENFPWSGNVVDELVVCENGDASCCDTLLINSPCACNIFSMNAEIVDCDETAGQFFVILNFSHTMTADSFQLGGNNTNYGVFAYSDLPLTLGPLPIDPNIEYEFLALDKGDSFCFNFVEIGVVDDCIFECSFSNLSVNAMACNPDGNFFANLTFSVINQGASGFSVQGNGTSYGTFQYGESSYAIGPLDGDCETIYEFVVIDLDDATCMATTALNESVCCDQNCEFSDFIFVPICDGESLTGFNLDFNHSGNLSSSFNIAVGETSLGTYNYAALPIQIIHGIGEGNLVFHITDTQNETCTTTVETEMVCGTVACIISDVVFEVGECDDNNMVMVTISFEVVNPGSQGFTISAEEESLGTFMYGESSYEVGPLPANCDVLYEFIIADVAKPDCTFTMEKSICCDPCEFSGLSVEAICDGEMQVGLIIDFNSENLASDSFEVLINTMLVGTYGYNEVPITLNSLGITTEEIHVLIRDQSIIACAIDGNFNISCVPECSISVTEIELLECFNGLFSVNIDFEFTGTSETFMITGSTTAGPFNYADLPITLDELDGDNTTEYVFNVVDSENELCRSEIELGLVDCMDSATKDTQLEQLDIYNINRHLVINSPQQMNQIELSFYTIEGKILRRNAIDLSPGKMMLEIPQGISNQIYLLTVRSAKGIKTFRLYAN